MKKTRIIFFLLLTAAFFSCAGPKPHRFSFDYNSPQALRVIREVFRDQGYRIAVFDESAGVIKTQPREFLGEGGETVRYQVAVILIKARELLVRVMPTSVMDYRDQIIGVLVEPLKDVGIHAKYTPPPRSSPKYWRHPPLPLPGP